MLKSKVPIKEQIEKAKTDIRQGENRINELFQKKTIMERKQRTRRLIERGAMLESFIDRASELTNEQLLSLLRITFGTDSVREVVTIMLNENASSDYRQENGASKAETKLTE